MTDRYVSVPMTFEHLCAVHGWWCVAQRVQCCSSTDLDPPPSESQFFDELSSLLDELATRSEPVIVAGDFNIRLDRPDNLHSRHLLEVLSAHGLHCRFTSPTHDCGGILDIVATRTDLAAPNVSVLEAGISVHRLLRWTCHRDDFSALLIS